MGLSDFVSRVLTTYKADTSDHKAKIRELRGEEKKLEQERLKATEGQNRGLDDQIKMWGKVGLAVGAAIGTFKLAQAATRAYLDDTQARAAAAGANIAKLQSATKGLVTEQRLLQFAGSAMHGTWKMNQQEMELVLQGALALRKQLGTELEPTIQKLMEAMRKGSAEELKTFGISAKTQTEFFEQLRVKIKEVGGETDIAGDSMRRASVSWKDSVNQLLVAIGELVAALAPLIEGLAKAVDLAARGARGFRWVLGGMSSQDVVAEIRQGYASRREAEAAQQHVMDELRKVENLRRMRQGLGDLETVNQIRSGLGADALPADALSRIRSTSFDPKVIEAANQNLGHGLNQMFGAGITAVQDAFGAVASKLSKKGKGGKGKGGDFAGDPIGFGQTVYGYGQDFGGALGDLAGAALEHYQLRAQGFTGTVDQRFTGEFESTGSKINAELEEAKTTLKEIVETINANVERKKTILETMFGTPAEIDLLITSLGQVGAAFNVVTGAAGAAMDAWITGQKSLGQAFKEAIAEGLRGLAVQATVEALKHTAFGVGALAFGPIMGASAAMHFKAAAMFGGVALAAGVGARQLGASTGQWVKDTPTDSAAPVVSGGGKGGSSSAEDGQRQVVIMLGTDFLALTDLEQRELMSHAIEIGTRKSGTKNIRHS